MLYIKALSNTEMSYFKYAFLISLSMLIVSCQNHPAEKLDEITVSIEPQKFFIEQLLGDSIPINVMIPSGANHATYAPSPEQLKNLAKSKLYVKVGHLNFEKVWHDKIVSINNKITWINQSKYIKVINNHHHEDQEHSCNGDIDPHIWTSPKQVLTMLDALKEELLNTYPNNKDFINANFHDFIHQIEALDNRCIALHDKNPDLHFMIFHPAYSYFARDYGFTQLSIEFEGKKPTPAALKKTIQLAKEKNIKTIFIQKEFDISNAEVIAEEIGAKIIQVNPLSENWLEEMNQFIAHLEND